MRISAFCEYLRPRSAVRTDSPIPIFVVGLLENPVKHCSHPFCPSLNTSKNQLIIAAAIFAYQNRMCDEHDWTSSETVEFAVTYDDMESFDDTDKRWWDWGYTRILPPDKFEIIKPYIQDKKRKGK